MKRIIRENGRLIMDVDGKKIFPIAYMSYLPQYADYAGFEKVGYNLFSACIYMGGTPANETSGIRPLGRSIWTAPNTYDFSSVEETLRYTLGDNPSGYVLLRINVNTPYWWREENPEELTLMENGATVMQSVFSEKWIADVKTFFERLKEYLDGSKYRDNVIAWQIGGMQTEEWLAPIFWGNDYAESDFSKVAQRAFAAWCEEKYHTVAVMNEKFHSNYESFAEIAIPSREKRDRREIEPIVDREVNAEVTEYYRFFSASYAKAISALCRYVKQIFNRDMFVGCFYGYIGQLDCRFGHSAIKTLLQCDEIDFFASPFTYVENMKTPRDWFFHSAMKTCDSVNKLWFMEADIRTSETKGLFVYPENYCDTDNERMNGSIWFGPETEEESIWNLQRTFAKVLTAGTAFWWFDMWGGWYKTDNMMRFMQKALETYHNCDIPFESVSEIAVILDQESSYGLNTRCFRERVYNCLLQLGSVGAPHDVYLKGMVSKEQLQGYKLVLYLAPYELSLEDCEIIQTLSKSGVNVLTEVAADKLREYCIQSGVHLYSDKENVVYANNQYICILAAEEGEHTLVMKKDCVLQSFLTGEIYRTQDKKLTLSLCKNESRLFKIIQ